MEMNKWSLALNASALVAVIGLCAAPAIPENHPDILLEYQVACANGDSKTMTSLNIPGYILTCYEREASIRVEPSFNELFSPAGGLPQAYQ